MARDRLDKIMVERGLAESRARAQAMILAGQVIVANQRIDKPGHPIDPAAEIRIKGETLRYASRGGLKLEAALREFQIDPTDKLCLDVGASTGGFTDCLLQHGAARVWAIDVGHNQLVWRLRNDPRVRVVEGMNARHLADEEFPEKFDIVTIDVSFISLVKILPGVMQITKDNADIIALIKPQFEVGKGEVGKRGIVSDRAKHRRVLIEIKDSAVAFGLAVIAVIASPILGAEGNREFLMHLKPGINGLSEKDIDGQIETLTRA